MENQIGTTALTAGRPAGGWIVSPLFDLLFLANLGWLLALLPGFVADDGTVHVEFWQIYFLTTPHRWITLFLVAFDPDRREGRNWLFVSLALVAAAAVAGIWLTTGAFTCLLLIDYVWNSWHFAAQHFGVLRMYSRKAGGGRPLLERYGFRTFIFYVLARTAGWSTGWLEDSESGLALLHTLDMAALAVPAVLLVAAFLDHGLRQPGRLIYLASVCGLYAGLLWALRERHTVLIKSLTVAGAAFHASEYLAIVTHYAWRREHTGSAGLFRTMAGRWLTLLAGYAVLLGLFGVMIERELLVLWQGLNLWAAFLHYTFDGLIWKLRRTETARALGLEAGGAS